MNRTAQIMTAVALAMAAAAPTASAQWAVGLDVGVSVNTLRTESGYAYDRHYTSQWTPTFGATVRYDFNSWFGLQSGVHILFKNYDIERSWNYIGNRYAVNNTFMDIPVMARFKFGGRRLRGYALAGAYMGAWLESDIQGWQMSYFDHVIDYGGVEVDETVDFDSRRDNRFDAGLVGGLGLEYDLSSRVGIHLEARYYYGLTDLQKKYMINRFPRYNNTLSICAGVTYTFPKNKRTKR